MSIVQMSDGTFSVSYHKRHPISRIPISFRRKGIKSKAEAKRIYDELVLKCDERIRRKEVPTWNELLDKFEIEGHQRGLNLRSLANYVLCLRAHTLPAWQGRALEEIKGDEIRVIVLGRLADRTRDHQKSMLKFFRVIFQFAIEKGYLKYNPTPQIHLPKHEKLHNVLNEVQIHTLLNQAKQVESEWYPIWAAALYTGMRNGELYALTWDKVDFENRIIRVDASWHPQLGVKSTKSGEGRYIEIAQPLLHILKELKIQSIDEFVFPRISKWSKGEQARELRMFLEGLGLPRMRFHDLRASWATILLNRGKEPIKVMKMAGWKDLKTMQFYIRKAGVDIKGITEGLSLHDPSAQTAQIINLNGLS